VKIPVADVRLNLVFDLDHRFTSYHACNRAVDQAKPSPETSVMGYSPSVEQIREVF